MTDDEQTAYVCYNWGGGISALDISDPNLITSIAFISLNFRVLNSVLSIEVPRSFPREFLHLKTHLTYVEFKRYINETQISLKDS